MEYSIYSLIPILSIYYISLHPLLTTLLISDVGHLGCLGEFRPGAFASGENACVI